MESLKQLLHADIEYSVWATQRLLEASSSLSPTQLTLDHKQSHRSVIQTLNHIYLSESFWADCVRSMSMPPMTSIGAAEDPPMLPLDELRQRWLPVLASLESWLEPLQEEHLIREIPCILPSGQQGHFPVWQIVRHSVNHATLHRGQIVGMFRAMGVPPPSMDIMGYYIHLANQRCLAHR